MLYTAFVSSKAMSAQNNQCLLCTYQISTHFSLKPLLNGHSTMLITVSVPTKGVSAQKKQSSLFS